MAYSVTKNKQEAYQQLKRLIESFKQQHDAYKKKSYSEAQLRIDFLNLFLKSFGWDVDNEEQKTQFLRDVIQEESIDVEEEEKLTKKNPDYTLRIFGNRKLFVEAKKVSININESKSAAFQTKRYGWSANMGMSILSNFENLIIYDCRFKPDIKDESHVSKFKTFHYEDYLDNFDELYHLLSFESVLLGSLDEAFPLELKGANTFDDFFLDQIEKWREKLAKNIVQNNREISQEDVNFLIQRLINRIIFLRICEDREIEKYETLKFISSYSELKNLFKASDKKYNSGLFDFIEDNLILNIQLDDDLLIEIFNELYYPISPYDFAVIDPTILSQIYEKYLGHKIELIENSSISIVEEPEVVASNGVVPTPKKVVHQIVSTTLDSIFEKISFKKSESLKLADICCGSGTFLISIFDYLIEKRTEFLLEQSPLDSSKIYQAGINTWYLTLKEKQTILTENIFGVDLNPYAVEVARFSLLLKLLEDENNNTIDFYLKHHKQKVLPNLNKNIKCGNSLLDSHYFDYDESAIENDELLFKIRPFDWKEEFLFLNKIGGFHAIIGNPPYVRIQNLIKYSLEEIQYYRSKQSPYSVNKKDTYDKYYLFLERAINLLNSTGVLGYIVPHKFFITKGGRKLRKTITEKTNLAKIIHFGVTQVFPNRSTYTAILVLDKKDREQLSFTRINNLKSENIFATSPITEYPCANYSDSPWVFISKKAEDLFKKISTTNSIPLKEIAAIPVGLQTSADKIYIFTFDKETKNTFIFNQNGVIWEIEKSITKPCIYDVSINLFDTPSPNSVIIFPYEINGKIAKVYSEQKMQTKFPKCWEYLNYHKEQLQKRSINGKEPLWYQYGRSQSLTKFHNVRKLIFPVLSTKESYAYDEKNILFTGGGNGPYYSIIPSSSYSIFYILGILSHPVIEAIVKSRASEFRGAYYSHGKQFIENLPIKKIDFSKQDEKEIHDSISKTVKLLVSTKSSIKGVYNASKKAALNSKYKRLHSTLIAQVSSLYDISADDLITVSGNQLFLTPQDQE